MVVMADPPAAEAAADEAAFAPADGAPAVATTFQAEVDFTLPQGYLDASGTVHRDGRMRLATARDELAPLVDPRVARNRAYLVVLLLSRVVTRLGSVPEVTPEVVEGLYATDFSYLQRLYRRLNLDPLEAKPTCPHCGEPLPPEVGGLGGSPGHPSHVTVEEVAGLAREFGWSYETLMSMSGAERRLWLAAARATGGAASAAAPGSAASRSGSPSPTPDAPPPATRPADAWAGVSPLATEAERRARLLQLHEELNHRGRRRA